MRNFTAVLGVPPATIRATPLRCRLSLRRRKEKREQLRTRHTLFAYRSHIDPFCSDGHRAYSLDYREGGWEQKIWTGFKLGRRANLDYAAKPDKVGPWARKN
jgi:hypothetical protein